MKKKLLITPVAVLALAIVAINACSLVPPIDDPVAIWTPAPATGAPRATARPAEILPTRPGATRPPLPTLTPTAQPTATPAPTLAPTHVPTVAPTTDANLVVISEADILRAIASGGVEQGGLTLEGAAVEFVPDEMRFSVSRLAYGMIEVRDVRLIGRLVAVNGRLSLETESIVPRGLVTALIPTLANQALAQYTSSWYITEVRTLEGQLELRIR